MFDTNYLVFLAIEPEDKFDQYPSCFETVSYLRLKGVHSETAPSQIRFTIVSQLLNIRLLLYLTAEVPKTEGPALSTQYALPLPQL